MIKSLNLSITNKCSANCIFCPNDRGKSCNKDFMYIPTFNKLITEAKQNNIKQIIIGENGDCFLHVGLMFYLRKIKKELPDTKVILFTNFLTSNPAHWDEIIKNGLVNKVICNIDSINPEQYRIAKNADFFQMWNNFTAFIRLRDIHRKFSDITLEINVLDPSVYYETLYKSFGDKIIVDTCDIEDTTTQTINIIKYLLHDKDVIQGILPCFWAERYRIKGYLKNNWCPQLNRIKTEAFIRPDGKWYACCLDSKQELVIGDIHENSLKEISEGIPRQKLIMQLEEGKFEEIGSPCNTVVCCHSYKIGGEQNERTKI